MFEEGRMASVKTEKIRQLDSDVHCVLESQKSSTFLTDVLNYKIELFGTGNCENTVWSLKQILEKFDLHICMKHSLTLSQTIFLSLYKERNSVPYTYPYP